LIDVQNKKFFEEIISSRVFERYVVLSKRKGFGTIEALYDKNFKLLVEDL
jgi:stage III sporulation protein AA